MYIKMIELAGEMHRVRVCNLLVIHCDPCCHNLVIAELMFLKAVLDFE